MNTKPVSLVLRVGEEDINLMTLAGETTETFTDERWAKFLETFATLNGIPTNLFYPHQGMEPVLKRVAAEARGLLK